MNVRKFVLAFYAGVIIFALALSLNSFYKVQAQCAAGVACTTATTSGGVGSRKQKPPLILPTNTPTSTPNAIQTFAAQTLTAEANPFLIAPAPLVLPTTTPTPLIIPPVAGPNFLLPGVTNIILAVLIIIVCFGGGIWYFFKHTGGQHRLVSADDLNPQPFPPKGMGDGSSQFAKFEDDLNPQPLPPKGIGDSSSQFGKVIHDGSNQFAKIEKSPGPPSDAANQFDKDFNGGEQLDKL